MKTKKRTSSKKNSSKRKGLILSHFHFYAIFSCVLIITLGLVFLKYSKASDNALGSAQTVLNIAQAPSTTLESNPGENILTDNGNTNPWSSFSHDVYWRQSWNVIQSSESTYNWSSIDTALAQAKSQGGKLGIRIMSYDGSLNYLPSFLQNLGNPPNWNSSEYMNAVHALITALGNRYNNNPSFGWFEVSPYGCWSEWNFSCVPSGGSKTPMTSANKDLLIQWALQAFPNKRVIMMIGGGTNSDGSSYDALDYALNQSSKVGIRADCLGGTPSVGQPVLDWDYSQISQNAKSRWMSAPTIFEYCVRNSTLSISNYLALSQQQIQNYHPVTLGDGQGNVQASVSPLNNPALLQNFNTAGFRFAPISLTFNSSNLVQGMPFTVTSSWANEGVSPAYDPWNVYLELKSSTNAVAWQGKLSLNLDSFLPGQKNTIDTITLPSSLSNGTYEVALLVNDPSGYYSPMNLAILGWQTDGSYNIGKIFVGSKPTPTPTPNPLIPSLSVGCQASSIGGAYITATWTTQSGETYDAQWGYTGDNSVSSASNVINPFTVPHSNQNGFTRVGQTAFISIALHDTGKYYSSSITIPSCP